MSASFDVLVIGAGPGGYVAAIRAAQLGLRVGLVDDFLGKDGKPAFGGTCLNVGCIPSKALLDSSRQFHNLTHTFKDHGISASGAAIDVPTMIARKDKVVKQMTGGITQLLKHNKVTTFAGRGKLLKDRQVEVTGHDGTVSVLDATNVILAAGSVPIAIPGVVFDHEYVLDNASALDLSAVPARFGVIGAGVIGCEMGSVWSRLGSKVTILEAMPEFLAAVDPDCSKLAFREFKKQGLDIRLGAKVQSATVVDGEVQVRYLDAKGEEQLLVVDKLLCAVGRRAASAGLLAEDCGVKLDARGRVEVDDHLRTSVPGVYGIGDLVAGPMLAHKASEEGVMVAELIAGHAVHLNHDTIPWVIYTEPEVAWVGKTEPELKAAGVPYKIGTFPFAALGRAHAMNETAGLIKIIAHADTDRLLGVHMVGANVSEMIGECVVAMEFHGSAEDLARIVHAHPTLSEGIHEAALAVDKRALHRAN